MKGPALEALKFRTLNEVLAAAAEAPGELGLTFVDAREHDERLSRLHPVTCAHEHP